MNLKKILSGALIGAFAFGIFAGSLQPVSAASTNDNRRISDARNKIDETRNKVDEAKDNYNKARDKFGSRNSDGKNPPEPPKDANGNPMAPPDEHKLDGDGSVKFEPPSDRNSANHDRTR